MMFSENYRLDAKPIMDEVGRVGTHKNLPKDKQDRVITQLVLLGCTFVYDDYGHPERAGARMYHNCHGSTLTGRSVKGYGYTAYGAGVDFCHRTNKWIDKEGMIREVWEKQDRGNHVPHPRS